MTDVHLVLGGGIGVVLLAFSVALYTGPPPFKPGSVWLPFLYRLFTVLLALAGLTILVVIALHARQ